MFDLTASITNQFSNQTVLDSVQCALSQNNPAATLKLNISPSYIEEDNWAPEGQLFISLTIEKIKKADVPLYEEPKKKKVEDSDDEFVGSSGEYAANDVMATRNQTQKETNYLRASQFIEDSKDIDIDGLKCVGIKNQGATCYMNSFLQVMFNLPLLRKIIYQINTWNEDERKSIVFNLQILFGLMQLSPEPVSTENLTRSFGWDRSATAIQHDIEEFSRKIFEAILKKIKDTPQEAEINKLISGTMVSTVTFPNLDKSEETTEKFEDLQLVVKNCSSVEDSLYDLIREEKIDDYRTDSNVVQKAIKKVRFTHLPDILMMHLARFQYDPLLNENVKINTKYVFPKSLDMTPFMAAQAVNSETTEFELTGVIVHSGNPIGGHYYSFLRAGSELKWYLFNDTQISSSTEARAIEDNYGGIGGLIDRSINGKDKVYSAYMLIYVRKSELENIYCKIDASIIPKKISDKVKDELKKEEARHEAEQTASFKLYDITNAIPNLSVGKPPLLGTEPKMIVSVHETCSLNDLYQEVAILTDHRVNEIRLWNVVGPNIISEIKCNNLTVKSIPTSSIYLEEVETRLNIDQQPLMFFLALYDFTKPTAPFRLLGSVSARVNEAPMTLVARMLDQMSVELPDNVIYYGQKKQTVLTKIMKLSTFRELGLLNCSLIVFQSPPSDPNPLRVKSPFKIQNLEYLWYYKDFADEVPEEADVGYSKYAQYFSFQVISKETGNVAMNCQCPQSISFDELKTFIAGALSEGYDEENNIGYLYRDFSSEPIVDYRDTIARSFEPPPAINRITLIIKPLSHRTKHSDESEEKSVRKVIYYSDDTIHITKRIELLFYRTDDVSNLIDKLRRKLHINEDEHVRLYSIEHGKLKVPPEIDAPLPEVPNPLRFEVIPPEQVDLPTKDEILIKVSFIGKRQYDSSHSSGTPFFFVIKRDEMFSETKERLRDALAFEDKLFNSFTFSIKTIHSRNPIQISDEIVLFNIMRQDDRLYISYPGAGDFSTIRNRRGTGLSLNIGSQ